MKSHDYKIASMLLDLHLNKLLCFVSFKVGTKKQTVAFLCQEQLSERTDSCVLLQQSI